MPNKLMGVEIRHLRYFDAVARHLSFSRASDELRVAQPALSRQIKDVENFVGVKLFDRTRARVRLTSAGAAFKAQVEKILMQVEIAITAAQRAEKEETEELVIGNDWRMSHPSVTAAVSAMRERHPDLSLTLMDLTMPEQVSALKEGRIHVGFLPMSRAGIGERMIGMPFATARMNLVVSCKHPLAQKTSVKLRELEDEQWLMMDGTDAHGYRSFVMRLCKEFCGFSPRRVRRARSREGVLNLAAVGEGVCLLADFMSPGESPMLKILPVEDIKPVEICAFYAIDQQPAALREFLKILREMKAPALKSAKA